MGVLKYRKNIDYLGVIISDNGSIKDDVTRFIKQKRPDVTIKFSNFCKINRNAPLEAKLNVLDTCVSSALLYAAETWGCHVKAADIAYKCGIKTALGVRQNTNTEIIYIETGKYPLHCRVVKAQSKFWVYVNEYIAEFPDSALKKVIDIGLGCNIPYLKYYQKLNLGNENPKSCEKRLQDSCMELWKQKITRQASIDSDSKLGTYYRINPLLQQFAMNIDITENERITISRYRTGSHSLAIEIGRFSNTPRENRLCGCGAGMQSLWHVFNECVLTREAVGNKYYSNLQEVFEDDDVHKLLFRISKVLKIPL